MDYESFDRESLSPWNQRMYRDIVDTMIQRTKMETLFKKAPVTLMDVGSGLGGFSAALCEKFRPRKVILVDLRKEVLKKAKERFASQGIPVVTVASDAAKLDWPPHSVDLIISRGSLRFWEKQEEAFRRLASALRPGGMAYLGGGRGSAKFQEKREREDPTYSRPEREAWLRRGPNYNLCEEELNSLWPSLFVKATIFQNEGDGRWIYWKKELREGKASD